MSQPPNPQKSIAATTALWKGTHVWQKRVGLRLVAIFACVLCQALSLQAAPRQQLFNGRDLAVDAKRSAKKRRLDSTEFTVAPGFHVEQVFDVPTSMGSWVSLTEDDRGNLIASDQDDAGLFLITPGKLGTQAPAQVKKLPVELSGAHGLVWAFDSLYAMVNSKSAPGLHRLTDTDKDGLVDSDEHLMQIAGGGEHGPHGIVLSPDGESIYVACGNHTDLPEDLAASRIPTNWGEDLLLPRRWDARGHAQGRLALG